jgi:hypothetical protein
MQEEQHRDKQDEAGIASEEHRSNNVNSNKTEISPQNTMDKPCSCGKAGCSCDSSGGEMLTASFVYAIGKVGIRFPNRSIELELSQATGQRPGEETRGATYEEFVSKALADPANRYIARQVCYILTIEKLETYILVPTDPLDIDRFARAVRPAPDDGDIDVVIGTKGPIASAEMCNGLMLPIVYVDQIYSFDRNTLMKSIPRRKGTSEDQFKKTTKALFDHIIQIADNVGGTDEHRALNYLAVRYDEIYSRTQSMQDENYLFSAVDVRPSRLSGARKIVDVIFSYESHGTGATRGVIRKWFVRVDVTEEFPFLVTPMQEYFER